MWKVETHLWYFILFEMCFWSFSVSNDISKWCLFTVQHKLVRDNGDPKFYFLLKFS